MILTTYILIKVCFIVGITSAGHDHTLTDIFSKSENGKNCKANGGTMDCNNEKINQVYGPKFQKVHLQLPRINPVRTGYERKVRLTKDTRHNVKTLAIYPPIFEIQNFLTDDECDAMIYLAKEKGLKNATATARHIGISAENSHNIFDQWDQNMDGSLSPREISEMSEAKHLLLTDNDVEKMYEDLNMDKDKNGEISYGELETITFEKFGNYLQNLTDEQAAASVHNIEQTSLWHDEDELLVFDDVFQDYHQRLSNLTRIPKKLIEESEPLQITLFKNKAHTQCSHDSEPFYTDLPCCLYGSSVRCRKCRFISIMYFLNDVEDGGELVFPLADNKTFSWNDLHKDSAKVCSKSPNASLSNLTIKPEKGKAIMWYNHFIGRDTGWMYTLDPLSLNGASHTKDQEKWIARTWINIVGDGVNELRPWKMGSNYLSWNNLRRDIVETMRNDDLIEGEPYLHDSKLTAIEDADDDDLDSVGVDSNKDVNMSEVSGETGSIENGKEMKIVNRGGISGKDKARDSGMSKENAVNREAIIEETGAKEKGMKEEKIVNIEKIKSKTGRRENDMKVEESKPDGIQSEEKSAVFNVEEKTTVPGSKGPDDRKSEEQASGDNNKEGIETKQSKNEVRNEEEETSKIVNAEATTMNYSVEARTVPELKEQEAKTKEKSPDNKTSPESAKKVSSKRNRSPEDGEGPLGPPTRISYPNDLKGGKIIENRLVAAVLMLIEEMGRDELEIIARSLHEKLQLACIPLMVNPFGPMG